MTLSEFLDKVIETGIMGAHHDYRNSPNKLAGAIAGFEACRGRNPDEIRELLQAARAEVQDMRRTHHTVHDITAYWRARCKEAEIEWIANCMSAVLVNNGMRPIIPYTARGALHAHHILETEKEDAK